MLNRSSRIISFMNPHLSLFVYPYKMVSKSLSYRSSSATHRKFSNTQDFTLEEAVVLDPKKWKILPEINTTKPIYLYPGFFTKSEVEKMKERISSISLEPAKVNIAPRDGGRVEKVEPKLRNNFVANIPVSDKTLTTLNHRLFSLHPLQKTHTVTEGKFQGNFDLIGLSPMMKLLSYLPPEARNNFQAEGMVMHRDHPELMNHIPYIIATYSFLACLNKAKKGGGLDIYSDNDVSNARRKKTFIDLEEGDAMLFSSNPTSLLHQPVPVIEGERLLLRGLLLAKRSDDTSIQSHSGVPVFLRKF